ncbi:hypothetical protein AB0Q95_44895 [Streptomyces sp. NPDC059900]|uniref:hypothetical protein n=1 Tax=Streptomyces sp. NPDC059900 TaxID=3155816 RepID=UPI00344407C7
MPDRPRGVLYTCRTNSQAVARTLMDLRGWAEAHGWPVLDEVYDLAPPAVPCCRRIGWCTVEQLVLRGDVNCVIAPAEREIARTPAERIALRAWLRDGSVCALYRQDCFRRDSCVPMRPQGARP